MCQNLAIAVANLENKKASADLQKAKHALVRQKQFSDAQNCLVCGEPEVAMIKQDFIPKLNDNVVQEGRNQTGWYYKNVFNTQQNPGLTHVQRTRP